MSMSWALPSMRAPVNSASSESFIFASSFAPLRLCGQTFFDPSHYRHWINLEIDRSQINTTRNCLHRRVRNFSQALSTPRLYEYLKTMFAFESRKWRRRGTEHSRLPILVSKIELLPQFKAVSPNSTQIR